MERRGNNEIIMGRWRREKGEREKEERVGRKEGREWKMERSGGIEREEENMEEGSRGYESERGNIRERRIGG